MKTVISKFGIHRMFIYKMFANQNSSHVEHIHTAEVNARQSSKNMARVLPFVNQGEPSQARTKHQPRNALVKEVTLQK